MANEKENGFDKKIYDALSEHYDVGTFDAFSSRLGNDADRQKFYGAISEHYDVGTFDAFSSRLGYGGAVAPTENAGSQAAAATEQTQQITGSGEDANEFRGG